MTTSSRRAVIIGAGIVGVLTACELLEAGWSVVLIDAGRPLNGSTARSATGFRAQFLQPFNIEAMHYGQQFYKNFANHYKCSPVAHPWGYLFMYNDQAAWAAAEQRCVIERDLGYTHTELLIGPSAIKRRFPQVQADGLIGAAWGANDGFLEPDLVVNRVLEDLRQRFGAKFVEHYNQPVCDIYQDLTVTGVQLNGQTVIGGDLFIDCTNAWSSQLQALLYNGTPANWQVSVQQLRRYLWYFNLPSHLNFRNTPMLVLPNGTYVRPELAGHQVVMGYAHPTNAEDNLPPTAEAQDHVNYTVADALREHSWVHAAEFLPFLNDVTFTSVTTAGLYGVTRDHNPIIGFDPVFRNWLYVVGGSGRGIMMAPAMARAAVQFADAGHDRQFVHLGDRTMLTGQFKPDRRYDPALVEGAVI